jgi:DME family drug/metabolite transporter
VSAPSRWRSTGDGAVTIRPGATMTRGFPLVAAAAALWGTDALFRRGLALELPAVTVVFWEHVVLVVLTLPILVGIPWRRLDARAIAAIVAIGAGASALATVLFTAAFRSGDPNTPLLLQKLQPFVALLLARALLKERVRPVFWIYAAVAIVAAWLITFPDPLVLERPQAIAGALAAGAAALWGLGTVLGRYVSSSLTPIQLTAARFGAGLPAAFLLLLVVDGPGAVAIGTDDVAPILLLSLVPGLLSLLLYYRGLQRSTASAATIAELAFPLSALTVNHLAFGASVTGSQLAGLLALTSVLVAMSVAARAPGATIGVEPGLPSPTGYRRSVPAES